MKKVVQHQFGLFGFVKPVNRIPKIPISAARIIQAKAEMKQGNYNNAIVVMRDFREKLEAIERSITNGTGNT